MLRLSAGAALFDGPLALSAGDSAMLEMQGFEKLRVRAAGPAPGGTLLQFPLDLARIERMDRLIRQRLATDAAA